MIHKQLVVYIGLKLPIILLANTNHPNCCCFQIGTVLGKVYSGSSKSTVKFEASLLTELVELCLNMPINSSIQNKPMMIHITLSILVPNIGLIMMCPYLFTSKQTKSVQFVSS